MSSIIDKPATDIRITEGPLVVGMLSFGLPLVLAMTCHGVFNLVDAWFIGRMTGGESAMAAIAICDPVLMVATIFANGISTASVAMISRARGRGDHDAVRKLSGQCLVLVAIVSVVFGIVGMVSARQIGLAMGAEGEVLELATDYLILMFGGIFSMIFLLQLTSILRAVGSSAGPTVVLILANALNIVVDPFLIDAEGILGIEGLPKMGLMGAGYATVGARVVGCLIALWLCYRAVPRLMPKRGEWRIERATVKTIVSVGTPNSLQLVIRVAAILFLVALVTSVYATAEDQSVTAAMGVGIRIDMVVLFAAMGWGAAAATFAGQNLGNGNPHRAAKATWIGVVAAIVTMAIVGVVIHVFAEELVRFLAPQSESLIAYGTEYLEHVAWSYPFAATGVVLALSLNGAGSTKAPAVLDGLAYILLICPAALFTVRWLESDQTGVWTVMAAGNAVLAAGYALWFARGSWRTIGI